MSVVLGLVATLGVVMIGGGSALDEPVSKDDRVDRGLGVAVVTLVLALIVALVL